MKLALGDFKGLVRVEIEAVAGFCKRRFALSPFCAVFGTRDF